MSQATIREAIEELGRELSAALGRDRAPRPARLPRSIRPHATRSTFRAADAQVARRIAA